MTVPILPDTASAAAPPVLLPYQQRWIADKSPLKTAEKSRRTGLTWAEAADNTIAAASARDAGGQNVYYIAYNQDMTIEYIQACAMWARAFDYAAGAIEEGIWDDEADRDRAIKTFTIKFPAASVSSPCPAAPPTCAASKAWWSSTRPRSTISWTNC